MPSWPTAWRRRRPTSWPREGSARKLAVACAYARHRLAAPGDPLDEPAALALLEPLERWEPIAERTADALWSAPTGGEEM